MKFRRIRFGDMIRGIRTAALAFMVFAVLAGCSTWPLTGLIYTNVRYPLTWDLHNTPVPQAIPKTARVIEIREPISRLGINARLYSNAIGDIAKAHGMKTVYFADQEKFSILGIWTSQKVIVYGE